MKEPWVLNICCCCCRGSKPPSQESANDKVDLEQGRTSTAELDANRSEPSPDTDAVLAERAIDSALRLSFHSRRSQQEEHAQQISEVPPPSYNAVLKDDERRNPATGNQNQHDLSGEENRPVRHLPGDEVQDPDRKIGYPQQQSVLSSSGDSDVVLTPPTTAPPTVIDEDSEDDERFHPARGSGR